MDERINVGTKVFLEGSHYNRFRTCVREGTISKVGRKYFEVTVAAGGNYTYIAKFHIDRLWQAAPYTRDFSLYFSMQEITDRDERNAISLLLAKASMSGRFQNLTLDQLRRVKAILDEGEGKKEGGTTSEQ